MHRTLLRPSRTIADEPIAVRASVAKRIVLGGSVFACNRVEQPPEVLYVGGASVLLYFSAMVVYCPKSFGLRATRLDPADSKSAVLCSVRSQSKLALHACIG